jgi:hypothetical protein
VLNITNVAIDYDAASGLQVCLNLQVSCSQPCVVRQIKSDFLWREMRARQLLERPSGCWCLQSRQPH